MKFLIALGIAMTFFLDDAQGCERRLFGTWKSDAETSMTFIRNNAKLQPKTDAFLSALLGHMTMTFAKGEVHSVMPDIEVSVSGEPRPFAGFEERKAYKILFCNKSTIVWSARRPFSEEDEATTFTFVGPDTVWIYLGSVVPGVPDLHAREYFQRAH